MTKGQKTGSNSELAKLRLKLEKNAASLPLAKSAKDIVHGEGSETADVMLIGEAPGAEEAKQHRPFVGRSGQLLRRTLTEVGLDPSQAYISNIVKARPPNNRDPLPEEIAAYKPFLDAEISLISPELIVTLGRFSMAKFLPNVRISQVHGRLHKVVWQKKQIFVLPFFHPAAALRGTKVMQQFTADCAKISKVVEWIKQNKRDLEKEQTDGSDQSGTKKQIEGVKESHQNDEDLKNQVFAALLD